MTPTSESYTASHRRGAVAFRIAALVGGAAVALAGCTGSTDDSPAAGGTSPAPATVGASTTVRTGGGATAPEPAPADTTSPAPVVTASGSPVTSSVNPPAGGSWDPCTLSESALSASGVDIATEARVSPSTFPSCTWQSADRTFELIIVASGDSMDTVLEPGTYTDLRRSEYYGRPFALFRSAADSHRVGCHIATPSGSGSIVFTVRNTRVQTDYGDPCGDAQRVGAGLFNSLP